MGFSKVDDFPKPSKWPPKVPSQDLRARPTSEKLHQEAPNVSELQLAVSLKLAIFQGLGDHLANRSRHQVAYKPPIGKRFWGQGNKIQSRFIQVLLGNLSQAHFDENIL